MTKKFGLFVFIWALMGCLALKAQAPPNVRYIHDEAGNLLGSVDANNNVKMYRFDTAGRLVSIDQLSAAGPVDIFFIEPERGDVGVRAGTTVRIHGIGFSAVPSQNQVTFFNGVRANVDEATPMMIRTRVPAGARTGPVQVTSPLGTATSRRDFKVNNCVNPPTGVIGWWPGDGHARDLIRGTNGGRQGTATYAPGRVSYAFNLDGGAGAVAVPHRANLNPGTADFTLDFWMKPTATGVMRAVLNKRDGCRDSDFWDIRLLPEGLLQVELAGAPGKDDYGIISATPVNDGSWHHVALVRQGAQATLYIDGQVRGSVNTKNAITIGNTAPLRFGSDPCIGSNTTRGYQGLLDEVDWFNRALSAAEVQAIFNAGESGKCKPE